LSFQHKTGLQKKDILTSNIITGMLFDVYFNLLVLPSYESKSCIECVVCAGHKRASYGMHFKTINCITCNAAAKVVATVKLYLSQQK
jgi:hypothetical protein